MQQVQREVLGWVLVERVVVRDQEEVKVAFERVWGNSEMQVEAEETKPLTERMGMSLYEDLEGSRGFFVVLRSD